MEYGIGFIGLTLLVFCIALVALIWLSNHYMRFLIKVLVVRKLDWLDFVQETALVPPDWRTRHEKAMAKINEGDLERLQVLKNRARVDYLKRMDKLIEFARVCTLVPNDAERNAILKDLKSIRQDWRENDDALFTPADEGSVW